MLKVRSTQAPADLVLSRLEKVKQTGPDKWQACCPAHDDRSPSLSIKEADDGKILLHCHAGCSTQEVVAALGLEQRDLFPQRDGVIRATPIRRQPKSHDVAIEQNLVAIAHAYTAQGQTLTADGQARVAIAHARLREWKADGLIPSSGLTSVKDTLESKRLAATISAAYKHGTFIKSGWAESIDIMAAFSPSIVEAVFSEHLKHKYRPFHRSSSVDMTFGTFAEASTWFIKTDKQSALLLAPLGSGKTSSMLGDVYKIYDAAGLPVEYVTTLCALVGSAAAVMPKSAHYQSGRDFIDAADHCRTTLNSFTSESRIGRIERLRAAGRGAVIVIDEAAQVASLLLSSEGGILERHEKDEILCCLEALRDAGCRFLLLDGDLTPTLKDMTNWLHCTVVECTEQQYAPPRVELTPVEMIEEGPKRVRNTPHHLEIMQRLTNWEKGDAPVVIASDGKEKAEQLCKQYADFLSDKARAIFITGENKGEPPQQKFLENPNEGAKEYALIVYNPVLGAGFSVTSVEAHLYCFLSNWALKPYSAWQLVRRFRRAAGDVIKIVVANELCRPRGQQWGATAMKRDFSQHMAELGLKKSGDIRIIGFQAALLENDLGVSNPYYSLLGHLLNVGVEVEVVYSDDVSGVITRHAAQKQVKEYRIKRVATARAIPEQERAAFRRKAKATTADTAIVERMNIETNLMLTDADHEPDGTLCPELVEAALCEQLPTRAKRLAWIKSYQKGIPIAKAASVEKNRALAAILGADDGESFVDMKHTDAVTSLVSEALGMLKDGRLLTADIAADICNALGPKVRAAHKGIIRPPKDRKWQTRWVSGLFKSWGFNVAISSRLRSDGSAEKVREYLVSEDDLAAKYAERFAARIAENFSVISLMRNVWKPRSSRSVAGPLKMKVC